MIHLKAIIIGLALASPPVAAWVLRGDAPPSPSAALATISNASQATPGTTMTKFPVEVVANGHEPKWIYIEAPVQSVPEPGVLPWSR